MSEITRADDEKLYRENRDKLSGITFQIGAAIGMEQIRTRENLALFLEDQLFRIYRMDGESNPSNSLLTFDHDGWNFAGVPCYSFVDHNHADGYSKFYVVRDTSRVTVCIKEADENYNAHFHVTAEMQKLRD